MAATGYAPVRVNPLLLHPAERRMSLRQGWRFRLDPEDRGLAERWFANDDRIDAPIAVPGCWQGQGFGGDGTDTLWDFQLRARVFRATYTGTGWYVASFRVPETWEGERLWLNFGGVHPTAHAWLNGEPLGANHHPFLPFGFEITGLARPGQENILVMRVSEEDRLFGLAYNWQGLWSGLYRGVELTCTGSCYLARLWLYPDLEGETLRVVARVGGLQPGDAGLTLRVSAFSADSSAAPLAVEAPVSSPDLSLELSVPSPLPWSPDAPNLYRVDAALLGGEAAPTGRGHPDDEDPDAIGAALDAQSERAGFVRLSTEGKQFLINGEPYFLRGTGDFISCPETGCPDTSRERWRKKLAALRDYGYNYVRCPAYVYPPEYLEVADEVGLLVQSEMGLLGAWGGMSPYHVYQWPKPTPDNYPRLKYQWDHIVMRDVNHPSANLYCMSNEYGTSTHFPRIAWQCYRDTKALKPTAFVIWTDGGYNADLPGDFVNAEAEQDDQCPGPLIQHEFRWWSAFPDVRITHKYAGAVRPYAAEIAREVAARRGQAHLLARYAENSQRLQLIEAKGKMEARRRDHPSLAGICHFNAMDTNPSPQGILDEFYEEKYADRALWQRTNGDTVVLCGLEFGDRALRGGETLSCSLFVSDYAHPPFNEPTLVWKLMAGASVLSSGTLSYDHTPYYTCPVGHILAELPHVSRPQAIQLRAVLREGDRAVDNAWDLWMFPAEAPLPMGVGVYGAPAHTWLARWTQGNWHPITPGPGEDSQLDWPLAPLTPSVVLTEYLDETLLEFIRGGGRAVLAASEGLVRPHPPNFGYLKYFFTPPANYGPFEDGQNGALIADHPLLGDMPHEGFADLQLFRLIDDAPPLDLAPFGLDAVEPVIRVIHRYPVLHPLGYLVEAGYGAGGLVISALDLDPSQPEARYLLAQICRHAAGQTFNPALTLSDEAMAHIAAASAVGMGTAAPAADSQRS